MTSRIHTNDDAGFIPWSAWSDERFRAIANSRRRELLWYLSCRSNPITRGALADYLARRENKTTVGDVERIEAELHHVHLPMLEAAGLIRLEQRQVRGPERRHGEMRDDRQEIISLAVDPAAVFPWSV